MAPTPDARISSIADRLREDRAFVTLFSIVPSIEIIELVALAGFDGVLLDTEHGSYGSEQLGPLILAAWARGIYPIVRVRANRPELIGAALDAGCAGVIVPQIGSAEDAEAAISAAKFAPAGKRGANPWVRAADFGAGPDWYSRANRETALILMIEGRDGMSAFDAIAALPGLDGIFVGPVDLSHSLGVPGEIQHPKVINAVRTITDRTRARGLTTGVFTPNAEGARFWLANEVKFIALGVDTGHIKEALCGVIRGIQGEDN